MDKMTKEEFWERVQAVNPYSDRIELLSEFDHLTGDITFRCKKHNYQNTMMARYLTKAICCPDCSKERPKKKAVSAKVGDTFGRLTVVSEAEPYISPKGKICRRVHCICECGNEIDIRAEMLTSRRATKSCGCMQKETISLLAKEYNQYDLSGEYGIGYTQNGHEFYFDKEDYDKIKEYCWNYDGKYVITHIDNGASTIRMHKLLMKDYITKDKPCVDHINGLTFDNRRSSNLRICSTIENSRNAERKTNTGWQGVKYKDGKYIVSIQVNKKTMENICLIH